MGLALTERLALLVTLDSDGAIRGLNNIGKAADRNLGKTENRIDRTARGMQKAGVGMLSAAGLAATALYKAGQAASDLGEETSQTEQIFGDASSSIGEFARGAAKALGQSETQARAAANTFGLFFTNAGKSADEAAQMSIELAALASDMASFKNTSPEEAVQALGAALRGESEPIRAYGVMLDDATLKQRAMEMGLISTTTGVLPPAIKQQAAYAEILAQTTTIQGDFARTSEGLANQQRITNAEFENAKASIGEAFVPIIGEVTSKLAGMASGLSSANEASNGLLSKLAAYGTIGLGAAGALSFVVGKTIEMRSSLGKLAGPLRNAEGGLNRFGKATVLAGTAVAAWSVGQMIRGATEAKINLDQLAVALDEVGAASSEQAAEVVRGLDAFGKLDDTVRDLADSNVIAAERLVEAAEAAGIQGDQLQDLKDIVEAKREADVQGAEDQAAYSAEVSKAVGPTGDLAGAIEDETDVLEEMTDALNEAYESTIKQFDANLGYRKSIDNTEDSLADLLATQKEHGSNSEEYRDALLDAEGALLSQADAAVKNAEDAFKAAGATLNAKDKAQIYRDELVKLAGALSPNSPLRVQLQGYIDKLNAIPKTVTTNLITTGGVVTGTRGGAGQQFRAEGGPVSAGVPYVVGEKGPEMFVPDSPGTIIPNSEMVTSGSAVRSGGGDTIVIQVGDREVARLYADGKVRAERRGVA